MADPKRGRVRGPFRVLGAVLGVLFVVAGAVLVVRTSYELAVHVQDVSRVVLEWLALGVGDVAIGGLMLRAAVTGRDPYVPDPE